ncbi:outer membrane beta-barrel protein [Mangrovibacterium diazotrophicum]|uniref:Outer membrane protein with beta-barrel domain n=1 Tax=Mangrovibacterium diazotrophicum TaxID=1261403 RepID=A0A419W9N6_9BACT|nr:outer membrane beta-barrel protein [Mangrovibacterium diazotrophicum]RKD92122.1 outer membrane protein with beta-barrel domain [Mangrovibacterium diazotrophicum]
MNHLKFKKYKQFIIAAVLLLSAGAATAQEYRLPQGEFSVYLKGPFSKLKADLGENGESTNRFGAGFGLQYSRYFTPHLSLSGALEYQSYRSKIILQEFTDSYSLTDAEGDNMVFRSSANSYRERQSVDMLNIPIRVQWETIGKSRNLFAATGIQIGLPISANYKGTAYGLKTSGYFPEWDAELTSPTFMGFGNWGTQQSGKEKLKLKPSYSWLFELGFKQQLQEMRAFYVSAYVELGLNNLAKSTDEQQALIGYNTENPTTFNYSSVINSSPKAGSSNYVNKVTTQGFGIKMRYAFSW